MDGVAASGALFVAYWARLRWRRLALTWHSLATAGPDGDLTEEVSSLAPVDAPRWAEGRLTWGAPALGAEIDYAPTTAPFALPLFDDGDGTVDWSCAVPAGQARLRRSRGSELLATGYAECIRFTVAPWRLPIRELRWGRWIADNSCRMVVWIAWQGTAPRTWVVADGRQVATATVGDAEILADDLRLSLSDRRLLRGRTLREPLSRIPGLSRVIPASVLAWRETRWVGRGSLGLGTLPGVAGTALFEHVVLG